MIGISSEDKAPASSEIAFATEGKESADEDELFAVGVGWDVILKVSAISRVVCTAA
jgi:hypothetical protein